MSCIFQLPFTWQRLCRLGQLEAQTPSRQGQAPVCRGPRHRTTPDSARGNGMFSFQSAQQAGPTGFLLRHCHHTTFQKGKCASPSKMASSLETEPSQGLSPQSLPNRHRGS